MKRILLLLLAFMVFFLSACGEKEIVQREIAVLNGSDDLSDMTEQVNGAVYDLIYQLFSAEYGTISVSNKERIADLSRGISDAILSENLSKENVSELIGAVKKHTENASFEVDFFLGLFGDASAVLNAEKAGRVAHKAALAAYDNRIALSEKRYEEYGFSYLADEVRQYKEERTVLMCDVGAKNFGNILRAVYSISALAENGLNGGTLDLFTNTEILTLVKMQKIFKTQMPTSGWMLIFALANRLKGQDLWSEFLRISLENGDAEKLAASMNDVMRLLDSLLQKLTESAVNHTKTGLFNDALADVFATFSEEEWSRFDEILNKDWQTEEYSEAAENIYGDEYIEYVGAIAPCGIEQLKKAEREHTIETFERYLVGICPAIAFGVFYDRT